MAGAVVLAGVRGAAGLAGLAEVLDEDARDRLQTTLIRNAATWAQACAPGRATIAVEDAAGVRDVAAVVPDGVRVEAQASGTARERIAAAVQAAFDRHGGPVLLARTSVPRLGRVHSEAALGDLAAGAKATFGPTLDGDWYLLGLASPDSELLGMATGVWKGSSVMARTLEVASRLGIEIGLLRMERRLETPADAEALRVDPLTPPEVADLLAAGIRGAKWGLEPIEPEEPTTDR